MDNPFTVEGEVALTPPNATLSYQVFNSGNNAIGQGEIAVMPTADSAHARINASIHYTSPAAGSIRLLLFQPGWPGSCRWRRHRWTWSIRR